MLSQPSDVVGEFLKRHIQLVVGVERAPACILGQRLDALKLVVVT